MEISNKTKKEVIKLIIIFGIVLWCVFNYTLFFDLLKFIVKLVMPVFAGLGFAFVINVPMKKIEKSWFKVDKRKNKKLIRILSLIISIFLIIGIVGLVFFFIIPEFIDALNSLFNSLPEKLTFINDLKNKMMDLYPNLKSYINQIDMKILMENTIGNAGNVISIVAAFIKSMVSKVFTGFIGFVLSIYILADKENILRKLRKVLRAFFSEKKVDQITKVFKLTNKTFTNFLTGQCLDAFLTGFEFFIILWIIKIPYALILGVLFAITALVPFIGAFITLVIGAALVGVTNPSNILWYVLVFFLLQQFDDNVTYPKIVGKAVGIPPIIALIAVLLGGSIFGFLGMIISIPLASVLYTIFKEFINYRLENKKKK